MGTTFARLAALSFATLTAISTLAIFLTFVRMIQPGESQTIAGMNLSMWYIFAATAAILSFALFALFTTLDSIRESNERIADVLEDMGTVHVTPPAPDNAAAPAAGTVNIGGAMRFRVTGIDRATGVQTSVIIEAKDKAEATVRARERGVRDLSRVEYIRRAVMNTPAQSDGPPIVNTVPNRPIAAPANPPPAPYRAEMPAVATQAPPHAAPPTGTPSAADST